MKKIKLIDFLEFVNFRVCDDDNNMDTGVIRIYYPDKDDMSFNNLYKQDRYFEYGVYDFSSDTRKRLIQTINPFILNCFVCSVSCNSNICLEIRLTDEEDIDDLNLDYSDYPLDGYRKNNSSVKQIFVCSPLRGDTEKNIEAAKRYCRMIACCNDNVIPIAPHIYFTNFLDDNIKEERNLGISLGLELLAKSDEIWVFDGNGISEGMQIEIKEAERLNIPIKYNSKGECL